MVSVTDCISDGFEGVKRVLFRPFDLGKWFVLGFSVFLAGLGKGWPSFNSSGNIGSPGQAAAWVEENMVLVLLITSLVLVFILGLFALFKWLSSRGEFMFLDCVVHNQAAVVEPWRRFRDLGNNLFVFRYLLMIAFGAGLLAVIALSVFLAWADILAGRFGSGAVAAMGLIIGYILVVGFPYGIFTSVIEDFLVPIMYRRNIRVLDALGVFRREVMPGNLGAVVLFYLMKIMFTFCAGIIMIIGFCLTCCLASLPYISSVVFLPVFVFFRCYSLSFLEQVDPQWRLGPALEEMFE